jgi:PadR family transcriptional regulator, regulatory protein AphA
MAEKKKSAGKDSMPPSGLSLNTLGYQLLGVVSRQARSGYDIVKQLEYIRPVKTSQVYPMLARLENLDLVGAEDIEQTGRPNKRIYSPTAKGRQVLTDWVGTEPDLPVLRDDFLTMVYSGWLREPQEVIDMFERRIVYLRAMISEMESRLAELAVTARDDLKNPKSWLFYRHVLLMRRLGALQQEIIWSRSVIGLLHETDSAEKATNEGEIDD